MGHWRFTIKLQIKVALLHYNNNANSSYQLIKRRFTKSKHTIKKYYWFQRYEIWKQTQKTTSASTLVPSLEFRCLSGDMIETYEVTHGLLVLLFYSFSFSLYDENTTNSLFKLNTSANTRDHTQLQIKLVNKQLHYIIL